LRPAASPNKLGACLRGRDATNVFDLQQQLESNVQKTLQAWVGELTQQDLPVLRQTRQALTALEKLANVSGSQISAQALPDPMMVLKVMRMANSGRASRFAQPVLTIEHAVMMNGLSASFAKMQTCPVLEEIVTPEVSHGWWIVIARAYHAACQARDWAILRLDMNVEEVYIATLLQELGEMALWNVVPEQMKRLENERRKQGAAEAEQQRFGFTLDALTLALAEAWNLPPLIASALRTEDCEAHPRARLVSLARKLARHAEHGWYDIALQQDMEEIADTLKISMDDATARIHRVAADTARGRTFPAVSPAATWLPLLPGPWPDDEVSPAPVVSDPFDETMATLAADVGGKLHLNDLMKLVLKGMRDGIGLQRLVFAVLTPDGAQLRARFVVGAGESAALRQFQFDMHKPSLFSKLMGKKQAFWMNDETRPKVQSLLDEETQRITEGYQFFAMSVAVRGRSVGLFYADHEANALEAAAYEKFKRLCTQAALNMERLAK